MYGLVRQAGPPPPPEPLEDQRYDSTASPYQSLRNLQRSLLSKFTALLHSLSDSQHSAEEVQSKLTEVRVHIVNIQHCLNSLRGKRANEQLILIMQAQLTQKRKIIQALDRACESAQSALGQHKELQVPDEMAPEQEDSPAMSASSRRAVRPQSCEFRVREEIVAAGERAGLRTLTFPSTYRDITSGVAEWEGSDSAAVSTGKSDRYARLWEGPRGQAAFERMLAVLSQVPYDIS